MIVSNPPYISTDDMKTLPSGVKEFEPHLALHGGDDGLVFYRAIVSNFTSALQPGGYLCFEFGEGQGDDICAILKDNGYTILERVRDFNDTERALLARYDRKEE
jgi:release factor glutamine methyltransferase